MAMDLRIGHLYPDLMSIYGDRGNVIALTQRAKWRGIAVETRAFTAGQSRFDPDWADVYFFGGGQDQGQDIVGADLSGPNGDMLRRSIAGGAAVFSVSWGYQLLGTEYVPAVGDPIPGLGALAHPLCTVPGFVCHLDANGLIRRTFGIQGDVEVGFADFLLRRFQRRLLTRLDLAPPRR